MEHHKIMQKRITKRNPLFSVLAVILTVVALTALLWFLDVFYYVGTYKSPDGRVRTTVYNRDVTELIPVKDHFTLIDEGYFSGRTVLWGEFDGLWWSHDSNYQVVSLMDDGDCWLTLFDYVRNTGNNLDNALERGLYGMQEFDNVSKNTDGEKQIEFRFLQWSDYDSNMLIYFSYLDVEQVDRDGYFWYNYASGEVTGVMFLETAVVEGVIEDIGTDFYSMALDTLDRDGNVRGFIFGISPETELRGLEELKRWDHVRVVFRAPEVYAERPWNFAFGQASDETMPVAISVIKIE